RACRGVFLSTWGRAAAAHGRFRPGGPGGAQPRPSACCVGCNAPAFDSYRRRRGFSDATWALAFAGVDARGERPGRGWRGGPVICALLALGTFDCRQVPILGLRAFQGCDSASEPVDERVDGESSDRIGE